VAHESDRLHVGVWWKKKNGLAGRLDDRVESVTVEDVVRAVKVDGEGESDSNGRDEMLGRIG